MSSSKGALRVGTARLDITPEDVDGLTNLWRTPFNGVHDRIYLRVLLVENGINTGVIVAADLVEFGDTSDVREQIEAAFGIPKSNVIITASHNHNAPRAGSVTAGATAQKGGPATQKYTTFVYERILEGLRQARAALQPAQIGIGKGSADINTNRDVYTSEGWKLGVDPDRPSDKTVWVVKFETLTGELIALLMNYAVHSVVIGPSNTLVTGDLAGAAERYVEQYYGGKVVVLWTLGAAGDQNPKYKSYNEDPPMFSERVPGYPLMDSLGQVLGEEVVRVTEEIRAMSTDVRIEAHEQVVTLPARIPPRDANRPGMEVEKVDSINIRIGLLAINRIAFTWVSGEIATNICWHLQRKSPLANTMMITIANDRIGYIVDDASYDTPTFASTASPLQRGFAESSIVNTLLAMISKVH